MNKFAPFLILIVLCSCGLKVEHGFKPPEDSLVREYFDKEIMARGISYTVDGSGYYKSAKQNIELMSEIEAIAYEATRKTSSVIIESTCALNKIKKYLIDNEVVFIVYTETGSTYIKASTALFNSLKIMEHSVLYGSQCENI